MMSFDNFCKSLPKLPSQIYIAGSLPSLFTAAPSPLMTTLAPCRRCELDACRLLYKPFRPDHSQSVYDFFCMTRLCAKCKVASKVYRHYSDKVFGQGRHDLQPCLEFACEKINGKHDEPGNWDFKSGIVCGGC